METPKPYAAPLDPEQPPVPDADFKQERLLKAGAEGTASGQLIALVEVNNLIEYGGLFLLLLLAGFVLGFRHGFGGGALAWLPLGGLIFPTHLFAMLVFGYRQPYVEEDPLTTIMSLFALIPAGVGVFCGALAGSAGTFVQQVISRKNTSRQE